MTSPFFKLYCLGANVEVLVNKDSTINSLLFQDASMHSTYNAYPEFLCLDATYKLLEIHLPVYILLCEDGNGTISFSLFTLLIFFVNYCIYLSGNLNSFFNMTRMQPGLITLYISRKPTVLDNIYCIQYINIFCLSGI